MATLSVGVDGEVVDYVNGGVRGSVSEGVGDHLRHDLVTECSGVERKSVVGHVAGGPALGRGRAAGVVSGRGVGIHEDRISGFTTSTNSDSSWAPIDRTTEASSSV